MLDLGNHQKVKEELNKNSVLINKFSAARIMTFLLFVVALICYSVLNYQLVFLILSLVSLIGFIAIVVFTKKYYTREKYLKNLNLVYLRHQARREAKISHAKGFLDKGVEFRSRFSDELRQKYLIEDVDIFGEKSLFQTLSNCRTQLGRFNFANSLVNGEKYREKRVGWPEKLSVWGENEEALELEANLMFNSLASGSDYESYINSLAQNFKPKKTPFILMGLAFMLDIILIILMALGFVSFYAAFVVLAVNLYVSTLFRDELNFTNATSIYTSIEGNCDLFRNIKTMNLVSIDKKFTSEYLGKLEKNCYKLRRFWQFMAYKNNIIFKLILNSTFIFEGFFQAYFIKYKISYSEIVEILEVVSTLEEFSSLTNLKADYIACIPTEDEVLNFENLSNPLVKNCVPNSFSYDKGVILTGSNMSGKTTFLRTIITNLLLASGNALVCATKFSAKKVRIYTSLRVKDELSAGISTFYAEINKIRTMVSDDTEHKFCFIDEIFKGTNTLDRVYGATKLIEKLNEKGTYFIVSTHDFELCDLPNITNYHFEETYLNDYKEISFDYTLKQGKSRSTNAIFLLKSAGIIEGE